MKDRKEDIEDLFRSRFKNEETPVSPAVWENIRKTLPVAKPLNTNASKHNFFTGILFWIMMGTLFVSSIAAALWYTHSSSHPHASSQVKENPFAFAFTSAKENTDAASTSKRTEQKSNSLNQQPNEIDNHSSSVTRSKELHLDVLTLRSSDSIQKSKEIPFVKKISKQMTTPMPQDSKTVSLKNKRNTLHASTSKQSKGQLKQDEFSSMQKNKKQSAKSFTTQRDHATTTSSHGLSVFEKKNTELKQIAQTTSQQSLNTNDLKKQVQEKEHFKAYKHLAATDSFLDSNNIQAGLEKNTGERSTSTKTADSLTGTKPQTSNKEAIEKNNKNTATPENSYSTVYSSADDSSSNKTTTQQLQPSNTNAHNTLALEDSLQKNQSASPFLDSTMPPSLANDTNALDSTLVLETDSTAKSSVDSIATTASEKKEKDKIKKTSPWSIDVIGSALLTSISIKATDNNYQHAVDDKKQHSKNLWGYSAGLMVNYKLNEKIKLSAGLLYTAYSQQYHFNYEIQVTRWQYVDSSWSSMRVDSINNNKTVKDKYQFLSIPLQVSYTFLEKNKITLSAIIGLRSNFLLKGTTYLANASGTDVESFNSGFRAVSFAYAASLELQYQWRENIALLLQPAVNYSANSIRPASSPISQKPYGMGLYLGLRFRF